MKSGCLPIRSRAKLSSCKERLARAATEGNPNEGVPIMPIISEASAKLGLNYWQAYCCVINGLVPAEKLKRGWRIAEEHLPLLAEAVEKRLASKTPRRRKAA